MVSEIDERCSHCGSDEIYRSGLLKPLAMVYLVILTFSVVSSALLFMGAELRFSVIVMAVALLLPLALPFLRSRRCRDCGRRV